MRTTQFIEVWREIISFIGMDPLKEVPPDITRQILRYVNKRVRFAWKVWPWPEWLLTEERAFRPTWNADDQYLRVSVTDGNPDEVFYIPNTTYYKVAGSAVADPPVGTLPTNATYFEELSPVDTFIAYDQRCKRSIGMALGVYRQNPRIPTLNGSYQNWNPAIDFRPSEKGIDVPQGIGPTVFIHYKMPVPRYTIVPYVTGKTYQRGEITLDPTVGECFQALSPTTALPADTFFWRRVPFLEAWRDYVCEGAAADYLMDKKTDSSGGTGAYAGLYELQEKQATVQYHNQKAESAISSEIDALSAQGQKFYWNWTRNNRYGWCCSQPWSGGTVSTLTDACEDELGWVYPTPSAVPQVANQYWNTVVALRASTASPSLDQIPTRNLLPDSLVQIKIIESSILTYMIWVLQTGTANPLNVNGEVAPLDYDSVSNVKKWVRL